MEQRVAECLFPRVDHVNSQSVHHVAVSDGGVWIGHSEGAARAWRAESFVRGPEGGCGAGPIEAKGVLRINL